MNSIEASKSLEPPLPDKVRQRQLGSWFRCHTAAKAGGESVSRWEEIGCDDGPAGSIPAGNCVHTHELDPIATCGRFVVNSRGPRDAGAGR